MIEEIKKWQELLDMEVYAFKEERIRELCPSCNGGYIVKKNGITYKCGDCFMGTKATSNKKLVPTTTWINSICLRIDFLYFGFTDVSSGEVAFMFKKDAEDYAKGISNNSILKSEAEIETIEKVFKTQYYIKAHAIYKKVCNNCNGDYKIDGTYHRCGYCNEGSLNYTQQEVITANLHSVHFSLDDGELIIDIDFEANGVMYHINNFDDIFTNEEEACQS